MSMKHMYPILSLTALVLLVINEAIPAKSKGFKALTSNKHTTELLNTTAIKAFQERLSPILASRIEQRKTNSTSSMQTVSLQESDIFTLSKVWNSLSPQFRKLYLTSVAIPDGLQSYQSPGGHFEILYETEGPNKVDTTDKMGFSSLNWREKTTAPNGIPDYIDQVGFALDSSWSMEIDRFDFAPPLVYNDLPYSSNRYKVLIEAQIDSYYAITYLHSRDTTASQGYSSYISLRNSWSDPEWHELGYDQHPENGVRVTCAHELFHAIQYTMSWDVDSYVYLDDFPYSWTEGTAASMEELAFDSINDYHQYSGAYFKHPDFSFFNNFAGDDLYTNVILVLYLYHHCKPGGGIDFVHGMYRANYETRSLAFSENLLSAGMRTGSSWPALLHNFHCTSFKTGSFADSTAFISDARFFSMTQVSPLDDDNIDTVRRTLETNSAFHLRVMKQDEHTDTISISAISLVTQSSTAIQPLYSVRLANAVSDSFITITTNTDGNGFLTITSWKKWDDLTIIVTNANPVAQATVDLFVQPHSLTNPPTSVLTVYPNPLSLTMHTGRLLIRGDYISRILLYSVNGTLIGKYTPDDAVAKLHKMVTLPWELTANARKKIAPGIYQVIVEQENMVDDYSRTTRHKLIVVP